MGSLFSLLPGPGAVASALLVTTLWATPDDARELVEFTGVLYHLQHGCGTFGTGFGQRYAGRLRSHPDRCGSIPLSDELQKRRNRGITEFSVDQVGDIKQLPDLAALECDLEDSVVSVVGQRLNLRIEDANPLGVDRLNKMRTVFDFGLTLAAEHHRRETSILNIPNKCSVCNNLTGDWLAGRRGKSEPFGGDPFRGHRRRAHGRSRLQGFLESGRIFRGSRG